MRAPSDPPVAGAASPSSPSSPLALTRRQFLAWSAALGGAAALPVAAWGGHGRVRMGVVGLGSRGRTALAGCAAAGNVEVIALCDRQAGLAEQTARTHAAAATWLATRPEPLFQRSGADSWILAAAPADQLALAAAACAAGGDVLLVPPICFDPAGLEALAAAASRHRRQVHVARATTFALDGGRAAGVLGEEPGELVSADLVAEMAADERLPPGALLTSLVDEVDFACELLGGRVVQALRVAVPSRRSGGPADVRLQLRLVDEQGRRRQLTVAALGSAAAAPAKRSRIVLTGARGALGLAGIPVAAPNRDDLALFLAAVRRRRDGAALSLPRLLEVVGHLY